MTRKHYSVSSDIYGAKIAGCVRTVKQIRAKE